MLSSEACDDTRPVLAEETCRTIAVCPRRTATNCPVTASQSRAVWSAEAVTTCLPSGLKAAEFDLILVSGQHGQQPAGGRVPEPRRVIRIIARRKQSGAVRAEKHNRTKAVWPRNMATSLLVSRSQR